MVWSERYDAPRRHVGDGLKRMPTLYPLSFAESLRRYALAASTIRPLNGFRAALLRFSTTVDERYSYPAPMARRPSLVCQAMAGSIDFVRRSASRETKRPIHGSSQLVRSPNAANAPTPTVRFCPIGTIA